MKVHTKTISISSSGNLDAHDITNQAANLIQISSHTNGTITLFTPSSTSGITTIEFEDGCLKDIKRLFDELADSDKYYAHNERWHDGNGHAHVCAAFRTVSDILCVNTKTHTQNTHKTTLNTHIKKWEHIETHNTMIHTT